MKFYKVQFIESISYIFIQFVSVFYACVVSWLGYQRSDKEKSTGRGRGTLAGRWPSASPSCMPPRDSQSRGPFGETSSMNCGYIRMNNG